MTLLVVVPSRSIRGDAVREGRERDRRVGNVLLRVGNASRPVQLVGVVGNDYPIEKLEPLRARGVDLAGLERADGSSFRWRGRYRHDLNAAETLETHLGVFSRFSPKIPEQFRRAPFVFLANIDPRLQLDVLRQSRPDFVAATR